MGIKSVIALLLGLVIQLAQVPLCFALESAAPQTPSVCCCTGSDSCPCVSESEPPPRPEPLVSVALDLKWLISQGSACCRPGPRNVPSTDLTAPPVSLPESHRGYPGVPLSVAFCCYII